MNLIQFFLRTWLFLFIFLIHHLIRLFLLILRMRNFLWYQINFLLMSILLPNSIQIFKPIFFQINNLMSFINIFLDLHGCCFLKFVYFRDCSNLDIFNIFHIFHIFHNLNVWISLFIYYIWWWWFISIHEFSIEKGNLLFLVLLEILFGLGSWMMDLFFDIFWLFYNLLGIFNPIFIWNFNTLFLWNFNFILLWDFPWIFNWILLDLDLDLWRDNLLAVLLLIQDLYDVFLGAWRGV